MNCNLPSGHNCREGTISTDIFVKDNNTLPHDFCLETISFVLRFCCQPIFSLEFFGHSYFLLALYDVQMLKKHPHRKYD